MLQAKPDIRIFTSYKVDAFTEIAGEVLQPVKNKKNIKTIFSKSLSNTYTYLIYSTVSSKKHTIIFIKVKLRLY